jgi:hypothetical protein
MTTESAAEERVKRRLPLHRKVSISLLAASLAVLGQIVASPSPAAAAPGDNIVTGHELAQAPECKLGGWAPADGNKPCADAIDLDPNGGPRRIYLAASPPGATLTWSVSQVGAPQDPAPVTMHSTTNKASIYNWNERPPAYKNKDAQPPFGSDPNLTAMFQILPPRMEGGQQLPGAKEGDRFEIKVTIDGASYAETFRVVPSIPKANQWPGWVAGDVHLRTFDEFHYDLQAAGEFVDAEVSGDDNLVVQSRFEPVGNLQVTVRTALAALVAGDRVGLYVDPASGTANWRINGEPADATGAVLLPNGGTITPTSPASWTITWPSVPPGEDGSERPDPGGSRLEVSLFANWVRAHLNTSLTLGDGLADRGVVRGLLGIDDGEFGNDLTPSGASEPVSRECVASRPAYEQPLYADFATSWLVQERFSEPGLSFAAPTTAAPPPSETASSLFDYDDPGHPDSSSYRIARYPLTCTPVPVMDPAQARAACLDTGVASFPELDHCILDVSATGDARIAEIYLPPHVGPDRPDHPGDDHGHGRGPWWWWLWWSFFHHLGPHR